MDTKTLNAICAAIPTMPTEELKRLMYQLIDVCTVMRGELAQRELIGEKRITTTATTERKQSIQQSTPPVVLAQHRREVVRR